MLCTPEPNCSRTTSEFPPACESPHVTTLPSNLIAANASLVALMLCTPEPSCSRTVSEFPPAFESPHVTTLPSGLSAANARPVALMFSTSKPSCFCTDFESPPRKEFPHVTTLPSSPMIANASPSHAALIVRTRRSYGWDPCRVDPAMAIGACDGLAGGVVVCCRGEQRPAVITCAGLGFNVAEPFGTTIDPVMGDTTGATTGPLHEGTIFAPDTSSRTGAAFAADDDPDDPNGADSVAGPWDDPVPAGGVVCCRDELSGMTSTGLG